LASSNMPWGNEGETNQNGLGDTFFEQAKSLLFPMLERDHLMVCQSILLLALREFGAGSLSQSWILTGAAMRMATSLGLNRSTEYWLVNGGRMFDERFIELRDRVWFGCVQLDTSLSLYMGRSPSFSRACTNIPIPVKLDQQQDLISWPMTMHMEYLQFSPVPGGFNSCWTANCTLAFIISDILDRLYGVGKESFFDASRVAEKESLERELEQLLAELPAGIGVNEHDLTMKVPPHILSLHVQIKCAMIATQYPFINLNDVQPGSLSLHALHKALESATSINVIAAAYLKNFGFSGTSPFFSHQLFMAATIWATASALEPQNGSYTLGLNQSLERLDSLKSIWPSAKHHHDLIQQAIYPRSAQSVGGSSGEDVNFGYTYTTS